MKNRKIIVVLIIIMVIINTMIMNGCVIKQKTTEYVLPPTLIEVLGQTPESLIEMTEQEDPNGEMQSGVYATDDGSFVFILTDKQTKKWIEKIEEGIEKSKQEAKDESIEIIVNDDYTELIFKISKEYDITNYVKKSALLSSGCLEHQIFSGIDSDKIKLRTKVINIKNGKVIVDVNLGEEYTINPEDWDE